MSWAKHWLCRQLALFCAILRGHLFCLSLSSLLTILVTSKQLLLLYCIPFTNFFWESVIFFPAQVRCPVLACTVAIHHPWCLMAWLFCQVLDNPSVSAIPDWWARIGTLSWNGMWLSLAWMDQHEKQLLAVHIWLHRAKRHMQALLPSHVTFCFCRDGICCSKFKSLWSQRVFRANLWQAVLPQV